MMPAALHKQPLFLVLLVLFSVIMFFMQSEITYAAEEVTIKTKVLNVRSGPGQNFEVIGQVSENEKFPVLEEKDSWYKIQLTSNHMGWVASWLVEHQANSGTVKLVEATVTNLNVRKGPDASFQVLTQIQPEQSFPFVKEEGDWIQIKLNETTNGWVAKWLVKTSNGEAAKADQKNKKGIVQATILNVRSGPNTSFSIVGKVYQGDQIEVVEVKEGWYKIVLSDDQEGWIAGDYITEQQQENKEAEPANNSKETTPSPQPIRQVKVTTAILNVREVTSLESKILDKLSRDTIVEVISEQGDWLEISYDGKKGWVANWLVSELTTQISNQPKVTILNNGTNLRKGPGTNFEVVARADQGESFHVTATEGDWFQIILADGSKAYIAGWIVSTEGIQGVEKQGIAHYLKEKKVVIDAGHGGKDNGATGSHFNTLEKVVNLSLSNLLKAKFEAAGADVVMTRSTDRYLTLQQRVDISIGAKADVFLSIHHNTIENPKVNGTITYFYSNGPDRALANMVQKELVKSNGLNDLKARKGNYFVLRENPRLAILIELGFLTNYNDELTIRTSKFQENSANGILHGVAKYFKEVD